MVLVDNSRVIGDGQLDGTDQNLSMNPSSVCARASFIDWIDFNKPLLLGGFIGIMFCGGRSIFRFSSERQMTVTPFASKDWQIGDSI